MLDFGIENVRGGEFGELFFTRERRNEIKERIAVKFEKCFNCLGNHRIKRCKKALDVNEDLKEFIDEIMDGDSSGKATNHIPEMNCICKGTKKLAKRI